MGLAKKIKSDASLEELRVELQKERAYLNFTLIAKEKIYYEYMQARIDYSRAENAYLRKSLEGGAPCKKK